MPYASIKRRSRWFCCNGFTIALASRQLFPAPGASADGTTAYQRADGYQVFVSLDGAADKSFVTLTEAGSVHGSSVLTLTATPEDVEPKSEPTSDAAKTGRGEMPRNNRRGETPRNTRRGKWLWRRLCGLFVGRSSGATFVEYIIVCGIVALGAIVGFQRLRAATSGTVRRQAQVVANLAPVSAGPSLISDSGIGLGPGGVSPGGRKSLPVIQPFQCFAAGTPVFTADGDRAIEAIHVGEWVWGWDSQNAISRLARVTRTYETADQPVIELEVPEHGLRMQHIVSTRGHPFWVDGRGWVPAADLAGEAVGAFDGLIHRAIARESLAARVTVYNLDVAELHSYFVGAAHLLVHNACTLPVQSYDQWKRDPTRPTGTRINHLNQNAVYGANRTSPPPGRNPLRRRRRCTVDRKH